MGAVSTDTTCRDVATCSATVRRAERWQAEFPYRLGRRRPRRAASAAALGRVGVAGALFAMTGPAGWSRVTRKAQRRGERQEIIGADDRRRRRGVHYFEYPDTDEHAILLRLEEDRYVAYSGICTHLSCEVYWDAAERTSCAAPATTASSTRRPAM